MHLIRLVFLLGLSSLSISASAQQVFEHFSAETVVDKLEVPWDMAFSEDGTLFFTERTGTIKRLAGDELSTLAKAETFSQLRVEGEAGLMGLALASDFLDNPYLYVCYSAFKDDKRINRVSRFLLTAERLENEEIILDDLPGSGAHNGCRLAFGPDGHLYISTGDAFKQELAQDKNYLGGKILRISKEGKVPNDNPFGNEVWSLGHRNPQGLAFSQDGRLFATEHGPENNDEVNLIEAGNNYGWPRFSGEATADGFSPALKAYTPEASIAVAGLSIYEHELFPWRGNLLFVSLKTGRLYRLELDSRQQFVRDEILLDRNLNSSFGRLRAVAVAPDGSIYISTSNINDRNPKPDPQDDRIIRLRPLEQ